LSRGKPISNQSSARTLGCRCQPCCMLDVSLDFRHWRAPGEPLQLSGPRLYSRILCGSHHRTSVTLSEWVSCLSNKFVKTRILRLKVVSLASQPSLLGLVRRVDKLTRSLGFRSVCGQWTGGARAVVGKSWRERVKDHIRIACPSSYARHLTESRGNSDVETSHPVVNL
jgi:hypothetical protein